MKISFRFRRRHGQQTWKFSRMRTITGSPPRRTEARRRRYVTLRYVISSLLCCAVDQLRNRIIRRRHRRRQWKTLAQSNFPSPQFCFPCFPFLYFLSFFFFFFLSKMLYNTDTIAVCLPIL